MVTYLCTDALFRQHRPPVEHAERPERLLAIEAALDAAGLRQRCLPLAPRPATPKEILRVHSEALLRDLEGRMGPVRDPAQEDSGWLDPDTYYGPGTWPAALGAAGAAVDLALLTLRGEGDNGLSLSRPPGHHATRDRAMGFCLLNNVAIAAAAARAAGARVAIVDFDVHHGNGTEEIFAADPNVLYISLHQYPCYPGTGAATFTGTGPGQGATINVPLPHGTGDAGYRHGFDRIVLPALRRFGPDLLLVSAGFDAHHLDPLADMALTEDGYAWMGAALLSAQPRLVAVLEGGYHLEALPRSVVAFLRALLHEARPGLAEHDPGAIQRQVRDEVRSLERLHQL